MPYIYFNAGMNVLGKTPKQQYIDQFQETLNLQFSNASDIFTIQEETDFASGEYQNVVVRITGLINATTADNVEDDYKKILFKEVDHSVELGKMYFFDGSYWITINVDKIKTIAQTVIVKRCNEYLRWIDETNGALYEVPCTLGYLINENRDYATAGSAVVVPSGIIPCIVQYNSSTRTIQPNQRFLFGSQGQWTAFKVEGGGINNFSNTRISNNVKVGFSRLTLAVDFKSPVNGEVDDLVNGIANYYTNAYSLVLNESSISGDSGQVVKLTAELTLNGQSVSRNLIWTSSDESIATVDASGLVTFVSDGTCSIRCQMENNSQVYDTCDVTVGTTPVDTYQVLFSPNENYVLEGQEKTWTCYLYKNNVQQVDGFTFVLNSGNVPNINYTYTELSVNSFKIRNIERFLTDELTITATSGVYSKVLEVSLKGAW